MAGVDGSATLVAAARDAEAGLFLVADAAALPFADDSFDLVVAYNVLMDLDDLPAALTEVARVLEPGGHFAACVLHPLAEAGSFASRAPTNHSSSRAATSTSAGTRRRSNEMV